MNTQSLVALLAILIITPIIAMAPVVLSNQKISKLDHPEDIKRIYTFSEAVGGCTKDHKVWVNTRRVYMLTQKSLKTLIAHERAECLVN